MSGYGPPGGGQHPDEPTDPWQGASGDPYGGQFAQGPYDQPDRDADHHADQDAGRNPDGVWGGGWQQDQAVGEAAYTPDHDTYSADWDELSDNLPQKPSQRTSGKASKVLSGLTIAAVLVLLSAAVVGFAFVFLGDDGTPSANPNSSAPPTATTAAPTSDATATPSASAQTGIDDAAVGDCLFDADPSDSSASLEYVPCEERGEDYYKVLMRYDGTTDESRCEDVEGYDSSFISSTHEYVLCVDELTEKETVRPS